MRRNNYNLNYIIIALLSCCLIVIVVVYAALSTTLKVKFDTISSSLVWDVGFSAETVKGTASDKDVTCQDVVVSKNAVQGVGVTLHAPTDKCTYAFNVINKGNLGAEIVSINPIKPSGVSCTTPTNATMVCGNITYKIMYDSDTSTIQPNTGDVLADGTNRKLYLTVEYTGSSLSKDFNQSNFGFTIVYGQH